MKTHILSIALSFGTLVLCAGVKDSFKNGFYIGAAISTNVYMVAENVEASVVPDDVLAAQAKRYRDLFEMYLRNADTIDRVTFWGVTDATSWLNEYPMRGRTDYPLFFDKEGWSREALREGGGETRLRMEKHRCRA